MRFQKMAALYSTLAKTAGVNQSILNFSGTARVFESQDAAVDGTLNGT